MDKLPLHQELKVTATELLGTVRKLLKDTSVRRIVIKNATGRVIADLPLFLGIVSLLLLPFWSVIALIAGSAGGFTVGVEREPGTEAPSPSPPAPAPVEETAAPTNRPQA